jgi:3-deoxy-manno-octulosonate cytidylyltransferase (CMP-KDO synthetase)
MTAVAIIPARFESSRYPGKPLVPILGVPMIVRVAGQASAALGASNVYVATDDDRIAAVVREHGFAAVMTSRALTGTDRIAEAARSIDADLFVNVQGDEPMLDPRTIETVVGAKRRMAGIVVNAMARIGSDEDVRSVNIPKVIANEAGRLVYMSRAVLPAYKDAVNAPAAYWKQVCVYAFEPPHLRAFRELGRKSALEHSEDIEILRFFELGVSIQMVEVESGTLAVDVPEDVPRVEAAMRRRGLA